MNHERRSEIEKELPSVINDTWKYSWHWERSNNRLTERGWVQALNDAKFQKDFYEAKIKTLELTIRDIEKVIRFDQRSTFEQALIEKYGT